MDVLSPVEPATPAAPSGVEGKSDVLELKTNDNVTFFNCKTKGHIVANCPVFKKKNTKPVALIKIVNHVNQSFSSKKLFEYADFKSFVMDAFVLVSGNVEKSLVKILRYTAASQSYILEGGWLLSSDTAVGSNVLVCIFCMQDIGVPLHKVMIRSELRSCDAVVRERPTSPIAGNSMIIGNDLAGAKC